MGSEYMVFMKPHPLSFKTIQNFVKGKCLINWGAVMESKLLESTALMCRNSIDSTFPWLGECFKNIYLILLFKACALHMKY